MSRATLWILSSAVIACGGAGPSPASSVELATAGGAELASTREENVLGLADDSFPELAPMWPALTSHAVSELVETFRVDDSGVHCLSIEVSGELASSAFDAWLQGAREGGLECEEREQAARCSSASNVVLAIEWSSDDPGEAPLEAIASEMGAGPEPSARAEACVRDLGASALSHIDVRLHRNGLLEPWRELHDRLGAHRFSELVWTREPGGAHEVVVRYRGDEEAFELADQWAREEGLTGVDNAWSQRGSPLSLALELRATPEPIVELRLAREP